MLLRIACNFVIVIFLLAGVVEVGGDRIKVEFLERLERLAYDLRMRHFAGLAEPRDDIIIVDIDEKSLTEIGRWPWRRDRVAELTRQLFDEYGAALVGYDILFAESDLRGADILNELKSELQDDANALAAIDYLAPEFDFDAKFARSLAGRETVLGYSFSDSGREIAALPPPAVIADFANPGQPLADDKLNSASWAWVRTTGYSGNLKIFLDNAAGAGHIIPIFDDDGIVRRVPVLVKHKNDFYEALSVYMLRRYLAQLMGEMPLLEAVTDEESDWTGEKYHFVNRFQIAQFELPVDRGGTLFVNYLGSGGKRGVFRYISASDIYFGRVSPEDVAGRIAIIGATAPGLFDLRPTPINPALPGVEIHATLIANGLDFNFLRRPADAWFYESLALLAIGIIFAIGYPFFGPLMAMGSTAAVAAAVVWFNLSRWEQAGEVYQLAPALLLLAALFIWNLLVGFLSEWRSKRYIQNLLSQYIPPSMARRISRNRRAFTMEGESKEITVLFSDVRGFTSISELFSPTELTRLMNRMLTLLSERIHSHGGTVDKYIGDAVMAFWNAPLDDPHHAKKSVLAAMDMQKAMRKLSAELMEKGYPEMRMGVGVNSGQTRVGNMGSKIRLAYTVMGDTVNLASRLEGLTKHYRVPILVGEETKRLADGIEFREVDCVRVKGKRQAVAIFEPLGEGESVREFAARFQLAMMHYRGRRWNQARESLEKLREDRPDDGLLDFYLERIAQFADSPPPDDWDGVTEFDFK